MRQAQRLALLILLGVGVLVLAIVVLTRNPSVNQRLLATAALLGGLAIVVVALPSNGR